MLTFNTNYIHVQIVYLQHMFSFPLIKKKMVDIFWSVLAWDKM